MPKVNRAKVPFVDAYRLDDPDLPEGRLVTFKAPVSPRGKWRVMYVRLHPRNGVREVTVYGPTGSQRAMYRTFRADLVRTVHRATTTA